MHLLMTVYLPWLELVLRTVGIDRKNRFSWLNTCKVEIYKSGDLQKWNLLLAEEQSKYGVVIKAIYQ